MEIGHVDQQSVPIQDILVSQGGGVDVERQGDTGQEGGEQEDQEESQGRSLAEGGEQRGAGGEEGHVSFFEKVTALCVLL